MSAANDDKLPENSANAPPESRDTPGTANNSSNGSDNGLGSESGLKPLEKVPSNRSNLNVPVNGRLYRTQSSDTLSILSIDDLTELRQFRSNSISREDDPKPVEAPTGWKGTITRAWIRNKGLVWVVLSQMFGILMNISARILESKEGGGFHPLQILFVRMVFTCFLSMIYMYVTNTPHFPLGAKEVRGLLVARGIGGFFGVFGIYWSLRYLPLSDATVLTFLAPIISCYACAKLLNEAFSRTEQIGAFVSLIGVVLIAQPASIFSSESSTTSAADSNKPGDSTPANSTVSDIIARALSTSAKPTSAQRLSAVGVAMIGVMGAVVAYVTIRWIGKRAHPLISVNYLAVCCLIVSTLCLAFIPSIPFVFPSTLKQWVLVFILGLGGFGLQFLFTAGLRYEKSSRATNMVYSQMLFALAADKIIWNDTPGLWSLGGSALILGSAVVIAVQKANTESVNGKERGGSDEEAAFMEGTEGAEDGIEMPDHIAPSAETGEREPYTVDAGQNLNDPPAKTKQTVPPTPPPSVKKIGAADEGLS